MWKNEWITVRIRILTHSEKMIWNTVRIRIQTKSISKKLPISWRQKTSFKIEPCFKWTLKTRHGTVLLKKSCTYWGGWHRIELCPRRPPTSCRIRVWLPCLLAHTLEGARLAGTERGGRPTRSTLDVS